MSEMDRPAVVDALKRVRELASYFAGDDAPGVNVTLAVSVPVTLAVTMWEAVEVLAELVYRNEAQPGPAPVAYLWRCGCVEDAPVPQPGAELAALLGAVQRP